MPDPFSQYAIDRPQPSHGGGADPFAQYADAQPPQQEEGWMDWLKRKGNEAIQNPTVMGAVGAGAAGLATGGVGLIPALAAAAGAGALGAGAAHGIQAIEGKPQDAETVAKDMAVEGLSNAAFEGVGRGAMAAGKAIYARALPKIVRKGFPNAAETGIKEWLPVSNGEGIASRRAEAAANTKSAIWDADVAGAAPVNVQRDIAQPGLYGATKRAADLGKVSANASAGDLGELNDLYHSLSANGDVSLSELQEIKQRLDELSTRHYAAAGRGEPHSASIADAAHSLADQARARIESGVATATPDVDIRALNARTQGLIGLQRASKLTEGRGSALVGAIPRHLVAAGLGAEEGARTGDLKRAIGTAAMTEILTDPGAASRLGIAFGQGGRALPNSLRAALAALEASRDDQ